MGDSHGHVISAAGKNKKSLAIVFGLTSFYLIVIVPGGCPEMEMVKINKEMVKIKMLVVFIGSLL